MNFIICLSVATSRMLEGFICQEICLLHQTLIHFGVLCVQKILKDVLKWLNFARLFFKHLKKYSESFSVYMHTNDFLKNDSEIQVWLKLDRVKRIWYLSPMRAAKVQARLRIRTVSPEPSLLAHTSSESRRNARRHKFAWRGSYIIHLRKFLPTQCNLWWRNGPRQAILCLRAFRHDKF